MILTIILPKMAKDILLYGMFDSYSATEFIENIDEVLEKEPNADIVVRINSPGGDVLYGWGAVSKFAELKNKKTVKVDGQAASMGLFYCCYAEVVEAVDVAEFLVHRAAYPSYIEKNPEYFTEDLKSSLQITNNNLRKALEAKIDVALFEKMFKTTLDEIFSMDGRKEVTFTAWQAKKIGLVQKVNTITPKQRAEIEAKVLSISASRNGIRIAANTTTQNIKKMTLAELKAENFSLFSEILDLGKKEGAAAELNRIKAWNHFYEVDAKAVKEGIDSGKELTQVQILELTEKKFSADQLKKAEADAAAAAAAAGGGAPAGQGQDLTKEQKEIDAWKKEVLANTTSLKKA